MGRLWAVLVDDPVVTVTRHLPAIMDELLGGVGASKCVRCVRMCVREL